jgi:hypothetical protein
MVRKLRSVWKPARIVSLTAYFERSEAVGARRCGLQNGDTVSGRLVKDDDVWDSPVSSGVLE